MQFYTITTTTNSKIIGSDYPQMECIDVKQIDGLDKISEHKGEKIDSVNKIYNLRMPVRSKITDVISCSLGAGGDFVISEKLYLILKHCECSSLQFFPITFEYKNELYTNFYWVHFVYKLEKFIDFERSDYDNLFIKAINVNKPINYNEFSRLIENHKKYNHFRLTKTVLKKDFPIHEDFFVLSFANQKKYISERLYRKILLEKITGLDIDVAHDIVISPLE